ncbi:UDP-2,3-diacylglucosamine diphosphatase [Endozoicomonas numazuensis]|uniref:UDP-2,3-diacylglucosamine hydrolase n=1 Tax=Endozoicomonas numazuensis TaxID=1137799 RepID=A0A081NCJ3_9GAMM|nr:UDP-2,3-diacylglucosamine diphosphatase [Endozoicomonas numazuensis]KEQ16166.1 UDP-2,3-diacylglucosamine hydrolase [Endozoicomonas numazuensis]
MNIQFISDLHLTPERPDIVRAFASYMSEQASKSDALYILGDFFEYWVGDDAMEPFHHDIARQLKAYTDSGKSLFIMAGNRDFAIGKDFLKMTGATWLNDPCCIDLNGETVLLMHGDLLCTGDQQYLRYRKIIRNPVVLGFLRLSPLSYRKNLAQKIRSNSKKAKSMKSLDIMDVTSEEVVRVMEQYQVKTLIHGHTHRPDIHDVELSSGTGKRIVLGDWDRQGWVLTADDSGLNMEAFDILPS